MNFPIIKKIFIVFFMGALLAFGYWLNKVGNFAASIGCSDILLQRVDSSDKVFSAITFKRACGATAPDTLQLNIQPVGEKLDAKKYPPFLVLDSRANVFVAWEDRNNLMVAVRNVNKAYHIEQTSEGVHIHYENDMN